MRRDILLLVAALTGALAVNAYAGGQHSYEVWAIDQSNSPGLAFGGTVHIWDGPDLERGHQAGEAPAETIDLGGAAAALCFAQTAANPVRPHTIAFNTSQTHAIISFVASGHVLFVHAASREPAACLRMSVGAGGARQAHMSFPAPDETYVTVANQNGKLLERINTDYATNTFTHDPAATLNLATCTTPSGLPCELAAIRPDNAPICPVSDATSRLVFVTLRGGGLFVVDGTTTPMTIVGEYDNSTVHGNGCMGVEVPGKMYIDSGGGTAANLHQADLYAFPTDGYSTSNPPNTPERALIFSDTSEGADAHGATLTKHGKYVWVADRGRNSLWVVDTETDQIVNTIPLEGEISDDPTPDLLALSPNGSHVFVSLRGPNPLTADPHVSTGSTPGVGVIKVLESGRHGLFEARVSVSNIDTSGVERADVHAMAVRIK
jgi:YVTN family beta-propeller protein